MRQSGRGRIVLEQILTLLWGQLVVNEDGTELTGELTGDIVHAEHKAVLLQRIAEENGISLQQVETPPSRR
jgi:phosphoserine phosphatase